MFRSTNRGKLEAVKQEMARVNINILGISELKWTGMGEFNSDDHYIYYCGQESLRRNGVAITVNKRVGNAVLGCTLKNDTMISVHFQGKPFNITAIQVHAPTSNAEEAEVEWFALEMNRDHSVVFEIAFKYCISDSFVDYDDYSVSSKGFLPTVVDIMALL